MSLVHSPYRVGLALLLVTLSVLSVTLVTSMRPVSAAPTGTNFDHIVIIAMENSAYASVFGSGTLASCPTSSAPFLCSMLPVSSTLPNLNNYGATAADGNDFNGCSAACYVGLLAGYTYGISDGYGSLTAANLVADRMAPAGLTWQAYCAQGCPRGNDHFPFTSFTDTQNSPNVFSSSSVSTSTFVAAADSASPPNFLWYTPTDSQNMHDNSVSSGDSYVKSFLVGSGSLTAPASGSLLASNVFTNPIFRTVLYLWWDECGGSNGSCDSNNAAPNLLYGPTVKKGYVSPDLTGMDEYASLLTIENNWGFSPLAQGDTAAKNAGYMFNDVFTSATPLPLSASFTYLPTSPIASTLISFTATASGGTPGYTYSWSFGDSGTATGLTTTHTYTGSGSYSVTLTVKDSASGTATSTQTVQVSPIPALAAGFTYSPSQPLSGQPVSLSGSASGGVSPYVYNWNLGDGSTSTAQSPSHTYSSSGSYTVTLSITDSLGTAASATHSITVSPPGALAASFTASPTSPVSGQTVTFTATASGGTGPYSYSWNLGGTSKTGNPVSQSFTNGTYTVSLTVTDSASQTATSSQPLIVLSASTGGSVPVMVGWGGVRMDESVAGNGGTSSAVFPGESASNMELLLIELKAKGYNTVRVDFDPYCSDTVDYNYMSVYSQTNAQRAVQIAQHYGFWILIDYHGYTDIFRNTSCWLSYWKPIVQNIGPLYLNIIWEPQNEPTLDCSNSPSSCPAASCSSDTSCVTALGNAYQQWIDQARSLGDTHWIVVQNLCSYGCGLSNMADGYPTVTDPLGTLSQGGKIFISLHSYMDYGQNSGSWNSATANSVAQQYYQAVVSGVSNTGWPALNTEGGTDPLCSGCAPDTILAGSSGYTTTTFAFIQALTNLYDAHTPQRINWIWWPAGSWTNTPGAGTYGAMQCNSNPEGWGCLLTFLPLGPPSPDFTMSASSPSAVNAGQSATSTITVTAVNGFAGTITLTDAVPSALTCGTISPSTLVGSGTASVSCSASAGGTYALTVTGTSSSLTHSAVGTFTVRQADFTITASTPAAANVGQSSTTTLTIAPLNGFTATVALTDTVPNGLSCGNVSSTSITGSGTATVSCSATNSGSYTLTITGTSGSLTHSTTTTFNFRDFTMTASSPASVSPGSSGTSTITLTALNSFSGTITISDTIPSGLSCGSLTPSSVSGSGTATLSCSSNSQGVYTVTVTATSSSLTHKATAAFTYGTPADFTITATSPSAVNVGSSARSTITITLIHGLTSPVTLTDNVPSGLSCGTISSTSFTGNSTATASCSSSSASTYTLTITGTSGSLTHTASATFTFRDFSLSANPSSLSLNTGAQGTSTISLNLLNGFGSTVTLTVSNPSGVTASLGTTSISGSGTSILTVSSTPTGSYTIIVTGTSGSLTRTVSLTITVGTQVSPVLTAPSSKTIAQTSTLTFTVTGTDSSIPTPNLTLSANQLPSGASFTTVRGTSPISSTFRWTPTTASMPGTYTVSFTVTDGVSSAQVYVIITVIASNVLPIITVPGPQNATVGGHLHFTVSANDPTGTGGTVTLSATGLASNMAFDPATGDFSFTPGTSQAGQTYMVNFTATDSSDPSWTQTQSVPIHVDGTSASQPAGGGFCLSCLLPRAMTTTAWLLAIGALMGIVSSIVLLHIRASTELASAKRRVKSLSAQGQLGRTYSGYQAPRRTMAQVHRRRTVADDD